MKKTLLGLALISGLQFGYAQKSVYNEAPNRLFTQGKEMFLNKNYIGCINTLNEFEKKSTDDQKKQEAAYMRISSEFYIGTPGIINEIKDFLEIYPSTYHRDELCFFIGTSHFQAKEWEKALYWLTLTDVDYLPVNEQEDYTYRTAYSYLQSGKRKEAKLMFGALLRNSNKYKESASFYYASIDFQDGNYKEASKIFRQLKNKPEYKENALFYLIQGSYIEGNLQETIAEGRNFISTYPQSENAAEVYRLLGSSYYKSGDLINAVLNYERYLQSDVQPFREDMFQLADAYYQNNTYNQAIGALKYVASNNDLLGQAGYMLLGQCYLKTGSDANALMAFDAASRATFSSTISEDALYNYVLLISKGSVSAFNQSIEAFQRFLIEYPDSKHTDEINSLLANTLISTKNYPAALNAISKIKSPSPQILESKQIILTQVGIQNYINDNDQLALNNFNAAINMGNYSRDAQNEAHFWRGETYYRMGNYSSAITDYDSYAYNVASTKKNYSIALYNLGYGYFQLKNYTQALNVFKKYVSSEKDKTSATYSDALNRIGDCYLNGRNFAQAEQYYSQAVTAMPGSADYAEYQKAFVKGLQRDYKGKIAALDDMMKKYPDSEYYDDALMEKAKTLAMLNREAEAVPVLEKLLNEYPRSPLASQAGLLLGQSYFNMENSQKSIAAYKKVIAQFPNTEEAYLAARSLEGVYKEINDIKAYASYMNSLGGRYSVSSIRQDTLTYMAAEALYLKNQTAQAKSALNKYLQSYPNGIFSGEANYNLGVIAYQDKDMSTALSRFNSAIEANNPKYLDDALIYASGIEFDKKNYEDAYKLYEHLNEASKNIENKGIAQLGMMRCAYLTHKDNEVVEAANNVIANTKNSVNVRNEARFYRGQSLNNIGKTDDAIKDLKEVAKDTRNVFGAESQYLLAQIYFDRKYYDNAEKQVNEFMKKGTPHEYWMAKSLIVLADVYAAKGDYFTARQYVQSLDTNYKGGEADIAEAVSRRITSWANK